MELFHASGLLYEADDTLHPGNWGRVILGAGSGHPFFYRELLFEELRLHTAPDKPSRLHCLFGLRTLPEIREYQQMMGPPSHAYRIEVPDDVNHHLADLAVFNRANQPGPPESTRAAIVDYWQGKSAPTMEVLVEAEAKVLERL